MTYTSLIFALFCLVLLLAYYTVPKKIQWIVLLTGSVAFYLCSGVKYILYVVVTAFTTYITALFAYKNKKEFTERLPKLKETLSAEELRLAVKKNERRSRAFMLCAVAVDLGILIVLKYLDFVLSNINTFLPEGSALPLFSFVLPLGLSFYTFSAVGYVVDVNRGKYEPERNFAKFFLYLTYFPQIIQGPIPRFEQLAPQLFGEHKADYKNLRDGYQLVLWGLFKKLVIADSVVAIVSAMLKNTSMLSGLELWLGMFVWGIQLYADFSGGIDVSRGVSQMFGITLDINFKRPYFALNLTDYWNRWHISLGNWLKDYFFYPVAFSKGYAKINKYTKKKFGKFFAKTVPVGILSLILFTIIGIWHGANWGEVLFGVFNGVVILISTLLEPLFVKARKVLHMEERVFFRIFRSVRTFLIITIARVISLPSSIAIAGSMLLTMFGIRSSGTSFFSFTGQMVQAGDFKTYLPAMLGCILLFIVSFLEEKGHSVCDLINTKPMLVRVVIASLGTVAIILFGAYGIGYEASNFIYSNY